MSTNTDCHQTGTRGALSKLYSDVITTDVAIRNRARIEAQICTALDYMEV